MYGEGKPLDIVSVAGYIPNMHVGRTYMPPFPGNEKELDALAHFIKSLQTTGESLEGVQTKGLQVNSINSVEEFNK
jgi:mono/diheme cytochrome c family protein